MAEFSFDIQSIFGKKSIIRIPSTPHLLQGHGVTNTVYSAQQTHQYLTEIIDRMGMLSAKAQNINEAITTAEKLRSSSTHTIYLIANLEAPPRGYVVGLLKVGTKNLFLHCELGGVHHIEAAPCILDFYVHEECQRAGYGKKLFDAMLQQEQLPVYCYSIDRPSHKFRNFLKKYFGLEKIIPQANNFLIFQGYFDAEHKQKGNCCKKLY